MTNESVSLFLKSGKLRKHPVTVFVCVGLSSSSEKSWKHGRNACLRRSMPTVDPGLGAGSVPSTDRRWLGRLPSTADAAAT